MAAMNPVLKAYQDSILAQQQARQMEEFRNYQAQQTQGMQKAYPTAGQNKQGTNGASTSPVETSLKISGEPRVVDSMLHNYQSPVLSKPDPEWQAHSVGIVPPRRPQPIMGAARLYDYDPQGAK